MIKKMIIALVLMIFVVSEPIKAAEITDNDIYLIASVTTSESGNQCILGQRYVIDTILNRADESGLSISGVVNSPNQYSKGRPKPSKEMIELVKQEIECRTNDKVFYFRTKRYHSFGYPLIKIQDHYFSSKEKPEEEK